MSKISEETRLRFSEVIKPYKDKINATLEKEKQEYLDSSEDVLEEITALEKNLQDIDIVYATDKQKIISRDYIQKALDERIERIKKYDTRYLQMIKEEALLIDTEGFKVGQINGLTVMTIGDYTFGKPSRITANTYMGKAGIVNIEREVEKRRSFGVFTGTKSRALMIDLLFLTVQEFKDRLTSHYVIDDILKLVRKNGKVQAAAGQHDDSIMSYLIALYVYTYGKNLNRWGIVKGMKEPGTEDDDKGAQEEDMYTYALANLSEEDQMFFQAQAMIQNGGKSQQQLAKESYYYNRMQPHRPVQSRRS